MHSKEGFFVGHIKKKGLGLLGGKKQEMAIISSLTATDPGANPGGYIEASATPFDIARISLLCILKRVSLWGI